MRKENEARSQGRGLSNVVVQASLLLSLLGVLSVPAPVGAGPGQEAGSGHMLAVSKDQDGSLLLPLKHTRVEAQIAGLVTTVQVTQEFGNPYPEPIEAIYVFPLPQQAAVYAMRMVIGERIIEGTIKRRAEARELYEQAKDEGKTASLLDQERPNIFTQAVANVLPGDDIRVELSYFHDLASEKGVYEFVFPMVVGPRYIPGQPAGRAGNGWSDDTTRVTDGSKISPPVLPPHIRSGHDIEILVHLDTTVPFQELETPTHAIRVKQESPSRATVTLAPEDRIPNKDFILRWKVAPEAPSIGWLAHKAEEGDGYFLLLVQPEPDLPKAETAPREYVFVIDTSGSMHGFPLEQCQRVMDRCLQDLEPGDSFQVILFAGGATAFAPSPVPATGENVRQARRFVARASGGGGTEFLPALEKALDLPVDPEKSRIVLFMSDGYIGYEDQVLRYLHHHRGSANLFPLGVGSSVNRYLIDAMARIGQGEPFYLTPDENPEPVVDRFFQYVSRPSLTGIECVFRDIEIIDMQPQELPDLFAGRPLSLVGRYGQGGTGEIVLTGWLAGRPWQRTIAVDLPDREEANSGLAVLWARRGIAALSDQHAIGEISDDTARKQITELALEHSLMSAYTSFVAIDSQVRNQGESSQTVAIPVPLPDQVSPWAAPSRAYAGGAIGGGAGFSAKLGRSCAKRSRILAAAPLACQGDLTAAHEESFHDREVLTEEKDKNSEAGIYVIRIKGTLRETEVLEILEEALQEWLEGTCLSGIQGTLTLSLEILPTGQVIAARILGNSMQAAAEPGCVLEQARSLLFPSTKAKSQVLVKLAF